MDEFRKIVPEYVYAIKGLNMGYPLGGYPPGEVTEMIFGELLVFERLHRIEPGGAIRR